MENTPNFDLYIDEMATYSIVLQLDSVTQTSEGDSTETPFDLSSVDLIEAQIRGSFSESAELLAEFTTAFDPSTPNLLELGLPPLTSPSNPKSNLPTVHFGWYDIYFTINSERKRLVGGRVFMNQAISK